MTAPLVLRREVAYPWRHTCVEVLWCLLRKRPVLHSALHVCGLVGYVAFLVWLVATIAPWATRLW